MDATRFAARVMYDGTDFAGSQLQPGLRTVQGELETAASRLFQSPVRVSLAGRTDAGVHARGQVMAVTAATRHDAETVGRALNALLPADVAVCGPRVVSPRFDPRRDARRRWYRYTILQGQTRDPLARRTVWFVGSALDLDRMAQASAAIEGTRDLRACSGPLESGRTGVRSVYRAGCRALGSTVLFDIEANAFLPQMVRRLVGALVRVGRGAVNVEEFVRALESGIPGVIGPVAPPTGLCLERVWYEQGTYA